MAEDFDGIVGASWVETATRDEKSTQSILVHFDYCNRQPIYRFHISDSLKARQRSWYDTVLFEFLMVMAIFLG